MAGTSACVESDQMPLQSCEGVEIGVDQGCPHPDFIIRLIHPLEVTFQIDRPGTILQCENDSDLPAAPVVLEFNLRPLRDRYLNPAKGDVEDTATFKILPLPPRIADEGRNADLLPLQTAAVLMEAPAIPVVLEIMLDDGFNNSRNILAALPCDLLQSADSI